MACCMISNSDFDKGGCVIQIEWTNQWFELLITIQGVIDGRRQKQ